MNPAPMSAHYKQYYQHPLAPPSGMSTMNTAPINAYYQQPTTSLSNMPTTNTAPMNAYYEEQPPTLPPRMSTMITRPMSTYYQQSPAYSQFQTQPQPQQNPSPSLTQPIAIPATTTTLGSPFLRAYPIELEAFNISTPDFLNFLDELNRIMVVSPPVRVLGLAGDIVGFVPSATAQIVGGAVSAAATLTTYGMSKGRSELFIRESNKTLFAPRGLKVDIVKLEVVARVASIPILAADGKVDKNATLLAPLQGLESDLSGQQRRLMALAPWTSPLMLYPDEHIAVPKNMLDSMHAYASERQRASEEKRILKNRTKAHDRQQKASTKIRAKFDDEMDKLRCEEDKVRRKEGWRMESQLRKVDKERSRVKREYEEEMGKVMGGVKKKDKEEAAVRKVLWLLIQRQDTAGTYM
jgi:hypothetical protein